MSEEELLSILSSFISSFSQEKIDEQSTIFQSNSRCFLVKRMQIDTQINVHSILQTLQQHESLSASYLLTLLHHHHKNNTITTIYQYGRLTLQQEISNRQPLQNYFQEEEIWSILYSVVKTLEYLERLNIGYGVLGCDRIFIEDKIKLIDPSAIAEDPFSTSNNRLYSPQVAQDMGDIDILKSDVYVLGLCVVEACLLISFSNCNRQLYDETKIQVYLEKIQEMYGSQLKGVLEYMLSYIPENRPSFHEIKQYLENSIKMIEQVEDLFQPMERDREDHENVHNNFSNTCERENVDVEQDEESYISTNNLTEFENARLKFLFGPTQQQKGTSKQSVSRSILNILHGQKRKVSKFIKDKVTKSKTDDLQIVQRKSYKRLSVTKEENQQIYTNPSLLAEIQSKIDVIKMNRNRTEVKNKENIRKNY